MTSATLYSHYTALATPFSPAFLNFIIRRRAASELPVFSKDSSSDVLPISFSILPTSTTQQITVQPQVRTSATCTGVEFGTVWRLVVALAQLDRKLLHVTHA